ncbi:type VI secretion system membrane subunit TssM [Paraburkholderia sp. J76]|uniref:type VI secretion system membrane subunit TssM n=1 Tax=Paraburkholderia sp. J76 TaxID=2805439 RepID=UPI002ABDAAE8|nr:type VI secretion system membrane subunit TssM [Paraburkholderia sp. J76]
MKWIHALKSAAFVTFAGVLALCALVWFEGPLMAFNGAAPLETRARRWALMVFILACWALYWGVRFAKARIASSRFVQSLVADALDPAKRAPDPARQAADADVAALRTRFEAALKTLRDTRAPGSDARRGLACLAPHRKTLYDLPWYLFVGAPGAGKTTALAHSGLRFPLADRLGAQAVGGVGGTRHCDWWFTDQAVLLDTAGRFTTQDSHEQADRGAWLGFLGLLRKYRPRRPLDGVMAVVSAADLLQQSDAARTTYATAIRARLSELNQQLGVHLPVYVVVTKTDMLAGFSEYFDDFGREEREQVWGMTVPLDEGGAPLAWFSEEFRLLHAQLQGGVFLRMQQETDARRRALIYAFPQQFAGIERALRRFLEDAFGESRFARAPLLRGVYFTSGTQSGRPLDRMMSAMAASLGLSREGVMADASNGRAYFVKRLLRDVIFAEQGLAGIDVRAVRRRARIQHAAIAGVGVLLVAGLIALFVSDRANRRFVDESRQQIAVLAGLAKETSAGDSPLAVLPLLDAARDLPGGEAERAAGDAPWWSSLGLDQRQKLGLEAQRVYQRLLRQTLLPIVVQRMEDQLRHGSAEDPATLYEALRAYLMLGDPTHFDPDALQVWALRTWRTGSMKNASDAQRADIERHLQALFLRGQFDSNLPLDQNLIAQARAVLNRVPVAQRLNGRIDQQLAQLRLPEFTVAKAAGPSGQIVFVRKSGAPLTQGIEGAFTRAGFDAFVRLRENALANLSKDDWVLGAGQTHTDAQSSDALRAALTRLYSDEAIRQWDALLADIRVVPFSTPDEGARIANLLGSANSPLRALIQAVARETTFAPPPTPVDAHFQALHDLAGAALDEYVNALKDAAATLQAQDTARKQSLPPPATGPLDRLKLLSQNAPAPLAAALQGVAGNADTVQIQSQRAQLQTLWATTVAPACRQALDGRYPLVRTSTRDAAPDDFARVLAPGGLIDAFFQSNLQNRVDTSGAVWKWRPEAKALGIPDDVPVAFQRAAMLRDALFREGGRDVSVRFSAKVVKLDPSLKRFVLDIDGTQLSATSEAPNATAAFQWPSGKGTGQAHVELDPANTPPPRAEGPWALFHLLDAARIDQAGQPDHFNAVFDGGKVKIALVASSVNNPLRAGVLDGFRCPASL